jgi:hypothetical protein
MTQTQADQDAFRARLSGQLHRIVEELTDAHEQAKGYEQHVPGTVPKGSPDLLKGAATAVATVLRDLDKGRGVTGRR